MASRTKSPVSKDEDAPLIDLNEASSKSSFLSQKKGYVTYDELNTVVSAAEMTIDQIEDINTALSEMGVQIVESDEEAEAEAEQEAEVEEMEVGEGKKDDKKDAKAGPAAKRQPLETVQMIQ